MTRPITYLLTCVFALTAFAETVELGDARIELSEPETLLEHGAQGLEYFPDTVLSAISRDPWRLLMTAGVQVVLMDGDDLRSLKRGATMLTPGVPGEFDNGYAGVCGAIRGENGAIYAIYHAEDHENMAEVGPGVPGYFAQIGLAVSTDDGATFEKRGVVLSSHQQKDADGLPDQGAGEACLTVDATGDGLLMYYVDHSRIEGRGVQICVAKADSPEGPWLKWRDGAFAEPGIGGLDTPVVSASDIGADATFPHVTWLPALNRYVMFFNVNAWRDYAFADKRVEPYLSGIYVAESEDGVNWSERVRVTEAFSVAVPHRELMWHPTLLLDDPNGVEGWLVYGYSPRWHHAHLGGTPHHMVGRRVRFAREDD